MVLFSFACFAASNNLDIYFDPTSNNLTIVDISSHKALTVIPLIGKQGKPSGVSGMHDARTRNSFIVALKDSPELWEINYQNPAPAGFGNWVHDYRKESGEAVTKRFPIRRIMLKQALDDFFFDSQFVNVISVPCSGNIQLLDLDLGRIIGSLNLLNNKADQLNQYQVYGLGKTYFQDILAEAKQFRQENCTL